MGSLLEELAGLLPESAAVIGRAASSMARDAAAEAARLLRPEKFRPMLSELRYGPTIPRPYHFGKDLASDGFMALAAYHGYAAYALHGLQPVTVGLVGLQTALQFKPSGYRLLEVGLNSRQVVQNHQLYRFVTAPLIHSSLPHLASNMAGLMAEGSELERRVGSPAMLAYVGSIGALSQALYVAGTWAAAQLSNNPPLTMPYYHGYATGFSGIVFGLQALVGYLREAERTEVPEEFSYTHGRYRCWVSLGVTHFLVPDASLAAHVAGILAGLLHIYTPRAWLALWRQLTGRQPPMRLQAGMLQRHRGRWWWDALGHVLVGGATIALVLMRRRSLARAGPGQ